MKNWLRVAALFAGLLAFSAEASPVRVQIGADASTGGGWLYSDSGGCFVMTARHVVFVDGRFRAPLLTDSAGVQGQGVEVTLPSPDVRIDGEPPDVARVRVEGALKGNCGDTLGYEHLEDTLNRAKLAHLPLYLDRVGSRGSEKINAAELTALNKDETRFSVTTTVIEGDSGFPIRLQSSNPLESGLPIGLLYESLGRNEALVLRFDAIRRWFAQPAPLTIGVTSNHSKRAELLRWSADTADAACGPVNLFVDHQACGWRPRPVPGRYTVELDLKIAPVPTGVSEVSVTLETGSSIDGFSVSFPLGDATDPGIAWETPRYCPATPNSLTQTCRFLERPATVFRLTIANLRGGIRRVEWK